MKKNIYRFKLFHSCPLKLEQIPRYAGNDRGFRGSAVGWDILAAWPPKYPNQQRLKL